MDKLRQLLNSKLDTLLNTLHVQVYMTQPGEYEKKGMQFQVPFNSKFHEMSIKDPDELEKILSSGDIRSIINLYHFSEELINKLEKLSRTNP